MDDSNFKIIFFNGTIKIRPEFQQLRDQDGWQQL